jgi:hypothetical protein
MFQGLQNQYPTSLHIPQNFEPSYFHDFNKLSELQMLLRGARKVRIQRLHILQKHGFYAPNNVTTMTTKLVINTP